MAEEAVKVTLFGSFSLTNGTAALREEEIHANKMVQLLVYIIVHRDKPVMGRKLNEQFWSGNSRNPESALKNLMYRLRNMLKTLGPEEYICTQPGGYQWNPKIPVETDYEEFEQISREVKEKKDSQDREELCEKAIACYRGNISARLAGEPWLQPHVLQYQMMYLDTAKILCGIYEQEEKWAQLETLCQKVMTQEPLDEDIRCWLVKGLQKQQKYDQALFQYESAKRQFYENFGIKMPKKLQQVFQEVISDVGVHTADISSIMQEAGEPERPDGAFFCDYQIFRQIYRLEMRRIGRIGISEYMLLLTVRRIGSLWIEAVTDSGLVEGINVLERVLRASLRIGDVVSRNGPTQYVVLLSACSYEAGVAVTERIRRNFLKKMKHRRIELQYELEELSLQYQEAAER